MTVQSLLSDEELRQACEAVGPANRSDERTSWTRRLASTLEWFKTASQDEREDPQFQEKLWEDNYVAAIGQGNISVDRALADRDFRRSLAAMSMERPPSVDEDRPRFIEERYQKIKSQLEPFVPKTPHLKIFRVLAVLYPELMTTIGSIGALATLARAMGADRDLAAGERHV